MSEETDMKCPYCGLELPGPPGQYNVCGHCRNKIFWMNGEPKKAAVDRWTCGNRTPTTEYL